jgi:hypothetical protein
MKIAMIINNELPMGLIANTAAVLGISLGKMYPEDIVGGDIPDADGKIHSGITAKTIPMLAASRAKIKEIRDKLFEDSSITTIDFSEAAQKCLEYDDYIRILSGLSSTDIHYLGICLYGPDKNVNKITGNLCLLR